MVCTTPPSNNETLSAVTEVTGGIRDRHGHLKHVALLAFSILASTSITYLMKRGVKIEE
jgi:hypothetical protein